MVAHVAAGVTNTMPCSWGKIGWLRVGPTWQGQYGSNVHAHLPCIAQRTRSNRTIIAAGDLVSITSYLVDVFG